MRVWLSDQVTDNPGARNWGQDAGRYCDDAVVPHGISIHGTDDD